jgi:hypothetical protein
LEDGLNVEREATSKKKNAALCRVIVLMEIDDGGRKLGLKAGVGVEDGCRRTMGGAPERL